MKRFLNDVSKYFKYAVYAAKAELKSEVANSYLNWVWWILEPVCMMLVYVFIFQIVFGRTEQYFAAFIYIGLTAWQFFQKNVVTSVKLVHNNKAIVSKVYIPKIILIISKMFVNFFKMIISFVVVIILMLVYQVPITLHIIELIPMMILLSLLTYAFSTIFLHFGVFVEDMQYVVSIVFRLLFYVTGVFFDISTSTSLAKLGNVQLILGKFNPMAFVLTEMRNCMIYQSGIDWKFYFIWLAIGIVIATIGTSIIYKNENSYVKVI